MVKQLEIGSSRAPLCMPQGAKVTIPPGASDEIVKKALTEVLVSRIEQAMQASHIDTRKYFESLTMHLMMYMRQCGEANRTRCL